jgi:hypothetical protein
MLYLNDGDKKPRETSESCAYNVKKAQQNGLLRRYKK